MRKIFTLLTVALTLSFVSQAQTKIGKVSGHIVDGNTKTIESATITLLRSKDSSLAKLSVANKNGDFLFEDVSEGKYLVSISAIGHQKGFSESFEINEPNQDRKSTRLNSSHG